jgi:hypothetical protein
VLHVDEECFSEKQAEQCLQFSFEGQKKKKDKKEEQANQQRQQKTSKSMSTGKVTKILTNGRREALTLYRDVLRATRMFNYPDEKGVLWCGLNPLPFLKLRTFAN